MNNLALQNEHGEYLIAYLLKLASYEAHGSTPYSDLTHNWIDQRSDIIQMYIVFVVIVTDLLFMIGIPLIIIMNFRHELKQFIKDPSDRLISVGGYEGIHASRKSLKYIIHFNLLIRIFSQ